MNIAPGVKKKMKCCEYGPREMYSQHSIVFVTYEWAQQVRVFVPGKPFQPSIM